MKKLTDWLILLSVLFMMAVVICLYRLPPKPVSPQIEQLQAIEARLERIEGRVQEIYEAQTTQMYQETLRRGY